MGAQTVTLARNGPNASFTSIDISGDSIIEAKKAVESAGLHNVTFEIADIFSLELEPESFDEGNRDLHRTTKSDGVFCYTFFKAIAVKR